MKLDRRASLLSSRLNFFLGLELRKENTLLMCRALSEVINSLGNKYLHGNINILHYGNINILGNKYLIPFINF